MLNRLAVTGVARRAAFTLTETRTLLGGFSGRTPSRRWRALAQAKLAEIDELLSCVGAMRALLHEGLECECLDLASCARLDGELDVRPGSRAG